MLGFNICTLANFILQAVMQQKLEENNYAWIGTGSVILGVLQWLCVLIAYLAFNVGNFYFAFHYFKCQSEMKIMAVKTADADAIEAQDVTRHRNVVIYWVVLGLNVLSVLVFGVLTAVQ